MWSGCQAGELQAKAAVPMCQLVAVVAQSMPQSVIWSSMNATPLNEALMLDPSQVRSRLGLPVYGTAQ